MGLFGFGKKDRVIDLTKRYKEQEIAQQTNTIEATPQTETQPRVVPSFFESLANTAKQEYAAQQEQTSTEPSGFITSSPSIDEKKRRLAKRLTDMTSKMEDLSNQIYHLQQRIELLERKTGVG